jgi:3',5'-cyclic AMP phosphodiesterase CpdA
MPAWSARDGAFRIGVISDAHVGATRQNRWHNQFLTDHPEETLASAVAALNRAQPDVVLVTGDLTDTASEGELATARRVLDALTIPWIACRGNHDQPASGDRAPFARAFGDRAPVGLVDHALLPLPDGVVALVLDAAWGRDGDDWRVWIPEEQVAAAVAALEAARPAVALLVCHFPFVRQSEYIRSRDPQGKNAGTLWDGEAVLAALAPHTARLLCFTGHQHFHHLVTGGNWLHCTTASLAEYPAEYRLVTLTPDAVTISTAPAAPDIVAANPPEVTWVRGREADRELTWPVPGP